MLLNSLLGLGFVVGELYADCGETVVVSKEAILPVRLAAGNPVGTSTPWTKRWLAGSADAIHPLSIDTAAKADLL